MQHYAATARILRSALTHAYMFVTSELFDFLSELTDNNDRAWFAANKHRYEDHVKGPLLNLISAFAEPLSQISPNFRAIPKVGGSLFRIHRDIRFSKDKRPYKDYVGIHFRHNKGKDAHAPGFYFHLEPDLCYTAGGIWGANYKMLTRVRTAIVDDTLQWAALKERLITEFDLGLRNKSLKRVPRGFDPAHPFADDLRRRHFIAVKTLTRSQVIGDDQLEMLEVNFRKCAPFVEFLTRAVGMTW